MPSCKKVGQYRVIALTCCILLNFAPTDKPIYHALIQAALDCEISNLPGAQALRGIGAPCMMGLHDIHSH